MTRPRFDGRTLLFLAVMAVGYAAAVYHATSDRWGNALIAAGAATIGTVVALLLPAGEPVAARTPTRSGERPAWRRALMRRPDETARDRWLSGSILAGFVATIVMSLLLVIAYMLTGFIGDENGGQISRWFWGLSNNDLTEGVYDIPIAAFSVNLLAGIGWALVYGGLAERRLPGPGWLRGMLFSLAAWALSLVVFFPAVGAGFFGSELEAGPLPALGNLVLHLIYGVVLGTVYAIPEVSADRLDGRMARRENDGMAIGLVAGLTIGLVVGAAISAIAATGVSDGVNITIAAGGAGVLLGGLLGSFAGLDAGTRREVG